MLRCPQSMIMVKNTVLRPIFLSKIVVIYGIRLYYEVSYGLRSISDFKWAELLGSCYLKLTFTRVLLFFGQRYYGYANCFNKLLLFC